MKIAILISYFILGSLLPRQSFAEAPTCNEIFGAKVNLYERITHPKNVDEILQDKDFQDQILQNPAVGKKKYWFHYGSSSPGLGSGEYYSADPIQLFPWANRLFVIKLAKAQSRKDYFNFTQELTGRDLDFSTDHDPVLIKVEIVGISDFKKVIAYMDSNLSRDIKSDWLHKTNSVAKDFDLKLFFKAGETIAKIKNVIEAWVPKNQ